MPSLNRSNKCVAPMALPSFRRANQKTLLWITVDKYDELVEKDAKRMAEIDDELVALAQGFEGSEMTISNLLKLATSASDLFKSSKPSVKNQILRLLVSNLKIKEKQLDFNPLEPFIHIKKLDSRPNWLPRSDSN